MSATIRQHGYEKYYRIGAAPISGVLQRQTSQRVSEHLSDKLYCCLPLNNCCSSAAAEPARLVISAAGGASCLRAAIDACRTPCRIVSRRLLRSARRLNQRHRPHILNVSTSFTARRSKVADACGSGVSAHGRGAPAVADSRTSDRGATIANGSIIRTPFCTQKRPRV